MADTYTIEDIVNVEISYGDRPITRQNVSTPLVLAADAPFAPDRIRIYTDLDDMISDGFTNTDPAYKLVANALAGSFAPRQVIVGNVDVTASSETYLDALSAIEDETTDWFFLLADTHLEADILALAAYAETERFMYITSSDDADIPTSADTDILSQLQALQYDHTFLWPHKEADTVWPEGGIVGAMASITPGASTLHGKTIPGVPYNTYTRTEASFIEQKNGNLYYPIGGAGFFLEGKMVSGRYFDIIRGGLNLEFRLEESIFGLIKRVSDLGRKIPYTLAGMTMIETVMYEQLFLTVNQGFLSGSPAPRVILPNIDDIPVNDKANRELNMIEFEAVLAGAIHRLQPVRGYLALDASLFTGA